MPSNENWNLNEANNEGAEIEEWRIHAIARQLEEALHFEARPEFNTELRSRLLTEIKTGENQARQNKNRDRRNWPHFLIYPGWKSALRPVLATVLLLGGLTILINFNTNTSSTPLPATATVIPVAEPEQEDVNLTNSTEPASQTETGPKVTLTDDGYWDEFLIRSQLSRNKKDLVASSPAKQTQTFEKRTRNGPLPVP